MLPFWQLLDLLSLRAIEVLFSVEGTCNYLKKTVESNDIIYSYLLDESCNRKTLMLLFPVLPKELQEFILSVCRITLQNKKISGDKSLCKSLLQNFD